MPATSAGVASGGPCRHLVLGWSSHLLPLERPSWSDTTGRRKQPREGFVLPAHQCWAGPWYVSPESMADPEGWQYAPNFQAAFRSAKRKRDYVRRRRWVRAIRDVDPSPAGSSGAPTDMSHPQSVVLTIGEPSE